MKNLLKILFSRVFFVGVLIAIQAGILFLTIWQLSNDFAYVYGAFLLISLLVAVWVINNDDGPEFKLAWVVLILVVPIFGGACYLFFGRNAISKKEQLSIDTVFCQTAPLLAQDEALMAALKAEDDGGYKQARYLVDYSGYPMYKHTATTYLTPGEMKFEVMKAELKKAKSYIFLEYFIIEEGQMWQEILDILVAKVQEGVDVRVMYDDFGTVLLLPRNYHKRLESMGIKSVLFSPFRPRLDWRMNNRDHRKICIIDGETAITGGINIADEYINGYVKHGHWKDASVLIQGDGAWGLTMMFLQLWRHLRPTDEDFDRYRPKEARVFAKEPEGFVLPFCDSPLDNERVGKNAYLQMITGAKKYVYINTPYLIIDYGFAEALQLAAKSGVDVRIVTPYLADKWYVHMMTRSFYGSLIEAGVKIYEYTPGFIHSKTFVSDDLTAIVGTINLDYRSLYHHFENGVWMYKTPAVEEVKVDFLHTLDLCTPISLVDCKQVNLLQRVMRSLMRLFAPLM